MHRFLIIILAAILILGGLWLLSAPSTANSGEATVSTSLNNLLKKIAPDKKQKVPGKIEVSPAPKVNQY